VRTRLIALACVFVLGCAAKKTEVAAGDSIDGVASPPGASLAYEHRVEIELPAEQIAPRALEAQRACLEQRFGDCAVLGVEEHRGEWVSASLTVRTSPQAVAQLLDVASEGGEVSSRSTRAEDLAQAVADTSAARARVKKTRAKLAAFAERKDLKIEDALTLSREMASLEVQLEQLARDAAQQRRRIDTNLLAIAFRPPGSATASNALVDALSDAGEGFLEGSAAVVEVVSFLAPFAIALGALIAAIRWWRRRRRSG